MKKKIVIGVFLFLVLSVSHAGAQGIFNINFNVGYFGVGIHPSYKTATEISLLHFGIEHKITKLEFEYNLMKNWIWLKSEKDEGNKYSFLNFGVYWNVLSHNFGNSANKWFLGPFSKINYAFMNNKVFDWTECVYSAGVRIGYAFCLKASSIYYNILNSEFGYRNIAGTHTFYANISADIGSIVYAIIVMSPNTKNKKDKKDRYREGDRRRERDRHRYFEAPEQSSSTLFRFTD